MPGALALAVMLAAGACTPEATESPFGGRVPQIAKVKAEKVSLEGLLQQAWIVRTPESIPHIFAHSEHDAYFLHGWVHAQDRLFQMDLLRRTASGTLAELVGAPGLASDVQLRTLGLRRAAERSWLALSPEVRAALEAYSEGVNAYLQRHPLPLEYQLLELSEITPWSPVDSLALVKLVVLTLSFDSDVEQTVALQTYQQVGAAAGFDGAALFFEDLYRVAPFDPAATVPDALEPLVVRDDADDDSDGDDDGYDGRRPARVAAAGVFAVPQSQAQAALASAYVTRVAQVPALDQAGSPDAGSNTWVISGQLTRSGAPLLANDPHLPLPIPANFHQARLWVPGQLDVTGSAFAGAPGIVLGHNRHISWGVTINAVDVTDTYQEQVVPDAGSPSGLSTVYLGQLEPIIPLPQTYRYNQVGDGTPDNLATAPPDGEVGGVAIPSVVLIVPRRNQGPIVSLDLATGAAFSLQYTGFSATREVEAFYRLDRADDLASFQHGLLAYDTGSLNFSYADRDGHIAYFAAGEIPLREDLQDGVVHGAPPFIVRDGTGGNEWIALDDPPAEQAVPFAVLPPNELPQIVDPPAGFIMNANNDPLGALQDNDPLNQTRPDGGIYYLEWYYRSSWRAGRLTEILRDRLSRKNPRVKTSEMAEIQADTVLRDAQYFVPHILQAYDNATADGADPALAALVADSRVTEAVGRLTDWDFTTPTGIEQGYDASDRDGRLKKPKSAEVDASVAATIYSVWRSQLIHDAIDGTLVPLGLPLPDDRRALVALKQLLDTFAERGGVGASGLDFFAVPDVTSAEARRDIVLLRSLAATLDALAGPDYAEAFAGSTAQQDYRWGKLHRVLFVHPLGDAFNVPPAGGAFPPPLAGLTGIPIDGGFGTVDAAWHDARGNGSDGFMNDNGAARRYVAELGRRGIRAETSLPGGQSGILTSPHYADLLHLWLTNDAYSLTPSTWRLFRKAESVEQFEAN